MNKRITVIVVAAFFMGVFGASFGAFGIGALRKAPTPHRITCLPPAPTLVGAQQGKPQYMPALVVEVVGDLNPTPGVHTITDSFGHEVELGIGEGWTCVVEAIGAPPASAPPASAQPAPVRPVADAGPK